MKKAYVAALGLVLASFAISAYAYPRLPEKVASHWDARGEVDGYMSRTLGLFLLPSVLFLLILLFAAIASIDPLKANIEKFRTYYDGFIVLFCVFMVSIPTGAQHSRRVRAVLCL